MSVNCCQISIIANGIDSISTYLYDACIALVKKNKLFCHILVKNEEMTHISEIFTLSEPSSAIDLICTHVTLVHMLL